MKRFLLFCLPLVMLAGWCTQKSYAGFFIPRKQNVAAVTTAATANDDSKATDDAEMPDFPAGHGGGHHGGGHHSSHHSGSRGHYHPGHAHHSYHHHSGHHHFYAEHYHHYYQHHYRHSHGGGDLAVASIVMDIIGALCLGIFAAFNVLFIGPLLFCGIFGMLGTVFGLCALALQRREKGLAALGMVLGLIELAIIIALL